MDGRVVRQVAALAAPLLVETPVGVRAARLAEAGEERAAGCLADCPVVVKRVGALAGEGRAARQVE